MKSRMFVIVTQCLFLALLCVPVLATVAEKIENITAENPTNVVEGVDGWLFFKEELEHIAAGPFWGENAIKVSRATKPEFADPIPAIVDFNNQLKALDIELLLVPIPPKAMIYPERLSADFGSEDSEEIYKNYKEFFALLKTSGVEVIDVAPQLLKAKKEKQPYCVTDTHYSGEGLLVVAEQILQPIISKSWYSLLPQKEYGVAEKKVTIQGDLASMADPQKGPEEISLLFVTDKETNSSVKMDGSSPVLLLGDSHTLVFSAGGDLHAKGAGLADHLTAGLGFPIDLLGVRGSGATPARIKLYQKAKRDKQYLAGKKVVVWCLTAREFTGSGGWRKVPVASKK